MIAKVVHVTANLTGGIIPARADFAGLFPVDAELVNRISEGRVILEDKEITPDGEDHILEADSGFSGLGHVIVHAIPNNYGLVTWTGSVLTIQ